MPQHHLRRWQFFLTGLLAIGLAAAVFNTSIACDDPCPPKTYTITGIKFADLNGDGERSCGEELLDGWKITLQGCKVSKFTMTESGLYFFSGLAPGTYTVCEVLKEALQHLKALHFLLLFDSFHEEGKLKYLQIV